MTFFLIFFGMSSQAYACFHKVFLVLNIHWDMEYLGSLRVIPDYLGGSQAYLRGGPLET